MIRTYRRRLMTSLFVVLFVIAAALSQTALPNAWPATQPANKKAPAYIMKLDELDVKGRAPKTGYTREAFGHDWSETAGCSVRDIILARDLANIRTNEHCQVTAGTLDDPYTGQMITFLRGATTSDDVQIDHVVALSNAWQTGAKYFTGLERIRLANDPLNLLAVAGSANQQKSDGDAATWLPANKSFRCQYIFRQIDVKQKYGLWVTSAEKTAMERVLAHC